MTMIFKNKKVLKNCHIYQMLKKQAKKRHISFHTPGHKQKGFDITELSYSDNLSSPKGCILRAEEDIARVVNAKKSFLLTDGSTSGVLSMLHAAKTLGVRTILLPENSHKSVFNGCALLGITPLLFTQKQAENIPLPITMYELKENFSLFERADALFLTCPDYYGNVARLKEIRALCKEKNKLLLIDGAHGSHLHFDKSIYVGEYADMWVDGAHKNLPTLTQGAIVSAKTETYADALRKAVDIFRTTSPSYPIMASVEYGVKYPQNIVLQDLATEFERSNARIYFGGDWTKLCAKFGNNSFEAERELQKRGIYPEFCDGNVLLFYLSPSTPLRHFKRLKKLLLALFERFPYSSERERGRVKAEKEFSSFPTEWLPLSDSQGRICAARCGLFPPCTPLLAQGEIVSADKLRLLEKADNTFGVYEGKICVYKEE